ncbi:MAG: ABC transporter permease, partial [Acidimicrobiales bacterium]
EGAALRPRRRHEERQRGLRTFTWVYLAWSLLPVLIAILFSFNSGRSQSTQQGFSLRWYTGRETAQTTSILHSSVLHAALFQTLRLGGLTTLICVPLGLAFALGIDRWRSRSSDGISLVMIFSFVVPELLIAVALAFFFQKLFTPIHLGTWAEVTALVVFNLSWPAIIIRSRLASIGYAYEEAAADLGASTWSAIRRVLLPLLWPAVFASAVLVFASVIDDFVLVEQLSSTAATQPASVYIYSSQHGGNGGPALNALATLMLLLSLVVAFLGWAVYRVATRGERGSGSIQAIESIVGV